MEAEEALLIGSAVILGLMFGSFATAAAYRIPRRESFVTGRSKCPNCGATITAPENIPLFSFIALRGRCRHCKTRISPRYPLIELGTGVLFGLAAWKFGLEPETPIYAAFFWVLVVLTIIDIEHHELPTRVIYPALCIGALALAASALVRDDGDRIIDMAIGAAIFGGVFFVIFYAAPAGGFGFGDVRFALLLGAFVGYLGAPGLVLLAMFLSFFTGALIGIALKGWERRGGESDESFRKAKIPFGPYMALGSVISIFWGTRLLDAYLNLF
jgi:leader peptidase (prepilin peptidase) / N-methyltransferase